ncbi:uncharacterized protein TNCV_3000331, partial [Trichonephila clavipes]
MPRSIEAETFAAAHVCPSNFQGFALKMEAVGATRIFQRSIVKRGFKYAHYYGDGDCKGFIYISVKDTYGKDSVTKYECIGHVQRVVGARLRKLKSKNKNLSGKRTWEVEREGNFDPVRSLLKSKNQEINRLQLAVKLPWAIFFESVDILSSSILFEREGVSFSYMFNHSKNKNEMK